MIKFTYAYKQVKMGMDKLKQMLINSLDSNIVFHFDWSRNWIIYLSWIKGKENYLN